MDSRILVGLFTITGASFGPICGAIAADYWLSGKKWAGPRKGINFAGYIAWAIVFVIGILPFLPISVEAKSYVQPAAVYSFIAGFIIYAILAKLSLQPKVAGANGPSTAGSRACGTLRRRFARPPPSPGLRAICY
ncbi:MAG: hypothetical protein ACRD6B_20615 [Bryobacteraceae bacterium]